MKTLIFVMLISIDVQAQTLGDIARAERSRQQAVEVALGVEKPKEKAAVAPKTDASAEKQLRQEWADVMRKSLALIAKLSDVRGDQEALKAIEAELLQLTKHAEFLERLFQ